jgi:peptidyl-prolyl cis-trans isomerase B (cyclophilin B)
VDGAVARARTPEPNSAGSQFFIVHGDSGDQVLTRDYVIFGQVDEAGLEIVDSIATTEVQPSETGEPSDPVKDIRILSAKLKES